MIERELGVPQRLFARDDAGGGQPRAPSAEQIAARRARRAARQAAAGASNPGGELSAAERAARKARRAARSSVPAASSATLAPTEPRGEGRGAGSLPGQTVRPIRFPARTDPAATLTPAQPGAAVAPGEARLQRKRAQAARLKSSGVGAGAARNAPDALQGRISRWSDPPRQPVPARSMMQFWDKAPTEDVKRLTDEVRTICEERAIAYTLLDEVSARAFLAAAAPEAVANYDRAYHPAMKADIVRLHWLFARGGYYCDADLSVTRELPTTMPAPTVLWVESRVANAFMFTVPERPLFALMAKRMHENLDAFYGANPAGPYDPGDVIALTGPRFLRRPVNEHFAAGDDPSVLFIHKEERRAFVVSGMQLLGRKLDYKRDDRNWHGNKTRPTAEEKAQRDARRKARRARLMPSGAQ